MNTTPNTQQHRQTDYSCPTFNPVSNQNSPPPPYNQYMATSTKTSPYNQQPYSIPHAYQASPQIPMSSSFQKTFSPDFSSSWRPGINSQNLPQMYNQQKNILSDPQIHPQMSMNIVQGMYNGTPENPDLSFEHSSSTVKTAFDIFSMVSGNQPQAYQYKMWSWMNWPLKMLKPYFQVSHSYVITKIGLVLFPFARRVFLFFV